jgi:hypothetical protein
LLKFLKSSNLEILFKVMIPPTVVLDVIDITLRSFRLLESFKDWEVSSEPYLFDHRLLCSLYRALYQQA